jgi:hypothetical protein
MRGVRQRTDRELRHLADLLLERHATEGGVDLRRERERSEQSGYG